MNEPLICARNGCDVEILVKKTVNQKYCSPQCSKIATNERVMRDYYIGRDRLKGVTFYCDDCGGALSMYNKDSKCASCQNKTKQNSQYNLNVIFGDIIIT